MVRQKVKLELIQDPTARKVTYKKRVKGILKKTEQLSIFCAVAACTIIYGPYDETPVFWPPVEEEVRKILTDFIKLPEFDQELRMMDPQSFMKQRIAKAEAKLKRLQIKRREMEMENLMADLLNGKPLEQVAHNHLDGLLKVVEDKVRSVQYKLLVQQRDNQNNNNNNNNNNNDTNTNNTNNTNTNITNTPSLRTDAGTSNAVVNSPPDQNPGNEMVMRGSPEMEAGPSNWQDDFDLW